jgi:hypothetical protein
MKTYTNPFVNLYGSGGGKYQFALRWLYSQLQGSGTIGNIQVDNVDGVYLKFDKSEMSPLTKLPGKDNWQRGGNPLRSIDGSTPKPYISTFQDPNDSSNYYILVQLYYRDNPAFYGNIQKNPYDKGIFGYHDHDVERVWILCKVAKDQNGNPQVLYPFQVTFSQHNGDQTRSFDRVELKDKMIVVYVAKNSHANYFQQGKYNRFLVVNDQANADGEQAGYLFSDMQPAVDWNVGGNPQMQKGVFLPKYKTESGKWF